MPYQEHARPIDSRTGSWGSRWTLLSSVAASTLLSSIAAEAQQSIQLDPVIVEAVAEDFAGDVTEAGQGRGDGTGPGEENEQDGFVAERSTGATNTNTPIAETPQSITVVTDEQIERQEVRTVRAATRYSAGITPETTGGADTRFGGFYIRGFDATANATYIDGLRLPSTASINVFGIDPYGAQRIEVLKGPSSVLYGQNGPGGLVNYVSKKPSDTFFSEAELAVNNFGLVEGRFDVSGPAAEGSPLSVRLTAVARTSDNQVDFVEDDRLFVAPAITWAPDDATSLTVLGNYQRDRAGWGLQFYPAFGTVFANDGRRIPTDRFLGEPGFNQYDTDLGSIGYAFEHAFENVFTIRQNARYAFLSNDQASFYGAGYLDEDAGLLNRSGGTADSFLRTYAIDNQVQAEFATGPLAHTVLAGLDYRRTSYTDIFDSFGTAPLDVFDPVYGSPRVSFGTFRSDDVEQRQTGLYIQDQIDIDRLSFILSGRYDMADTEALNVLTGAVAEADAKAFTGRVGAIYNFDNGLAPYLTYSESFLPPLDVSAAGDLFSPEEGRLYEAGLKFEPDGYNALLTASAFRIVRDDVIRFDAVAGTFEARQTGQIESRGLELEGVASLSDNVNLRLAYTYLDVEITDDPDGGFAGNTPVTVPEHLASAWLDYTIRNGSRLDGLGAGLGVRYTGSSFGDDGNTFEVPSSTVLDAAVFYERENVELSLNVSNLLDEEYVASCGNREIFCFYGEERRVTGKVTVRW